MVVGWREVLAAESESASIVPRNPLNTQKAEPCRETVNFAFNANCASSSQGSNESRLLEALAKACESHDLLPYDARQAMSSCDAAAYDRGELGEEMLSGFVNALVQRRAMDTGVCPDSYSKRADCAGCGPVWLWISGNVIACPWCKNRAHSLPIPRPESVMCGKCRYFERTEHKFLGHCAAGQWEAPAGLVSTDPRSCERYLPLATIAERARSLGDS